MSLLSESSHDSKSDVVSPNLTEVIIIRHGETEWNAQGIFQGQADIDLNEKGRKQAFAVAEKLKHGSKISMVYSSDLKRAFETSEAIAKICGGLEVIKDRGLRERHMGNLEGVLWHEIETVLCPLAYQAFTSKQRDLEIPGGGESLDQLYERVVTSLNRIASKHRGERIVVVSHGASIENLYRRATSGGISPGIPNVSINVLHLFEDDKWEVKIWGDVSHLEG